MKLDPNWISAAVAIVALIISIVASRSAEKSRKRTVELEEQTAKLTESQTRLAHQAWSDEYFREITQWACQVCMALSQACHLVGRNDVEERQKILVSLSAFIDMGRWYFPNSQDFKKYTDKEPAYQGVRQAVLDWVVLAYNVCENESNFQNPRDVITRCQRNFVSIIQEKIDPRSRDEAIKKVLGEFGHVSELPKVQSPPQ